MTGTNDVVYGEFEYVGDLPVVPPARLVAAGTTADQAAETVAPVGVAGSMGSAASAAAPAGAIDQVRVLAERAVHVARDVVSSVTTHPVALPFGLGQVPVPAVDMSRLDLEVASLDRARQELGALAHSARGHLASVADDARRSVDSTARRIRQAVGA